MTLIEKAKSLRKIIESAMQSVDDVTALDAVTLFPKWSGESVEYTAGQRVRDGDVLYTVLQPHTSQPAWKPKDAPSLFAKVLIPDPTDIPEWEQPGSTNPYMKGDKVKHNGKVWVSLVDNNVWEPGVTGTAALWQEVTA